METDPSGTSPPHTFHTNYTPDEIINLIPFPQRYLMPYDRRCVIRRTRRQEVVNRLQAIYASHMAAQSPIAIYPTPAKIVADAQLIARACEAAKKHEHQIYMDCGASPSQYDKIAAESRRADVKYL